jgi:putative transposase
VLTDRSAAVDTVSARIPTLGHAPHRQPDPDVRRRRGAAYNLHAHLIFVTKYRRAVFTDEMLTFCEHLTRSVCADLDAELRQCNGETDHVDLLAHYPPSLALSVLVNRLKNVSSRRLRQQYPTEIRKYLWGAHSGPRPTSPPPAEGAPLVVIKRYIEQQQRPD